MFREIFLVSAKDLRDSSRHVILSRVMFVSNISSLPHSRRKCMRGRPRKAGKIACNAQRAPRVQRLVAEFVQLTQQIDRANDVVRFEPVGDRGGTRLLELVLLQDQIDNRPVDGQRLTKVRRTNVCDVQVSEVQIDHICVRL